MDELLTDLFLEAHAEPPSRIVLDLDATDDPVHGNQEGRFFHGYYREYCYLPLYIVCGVFVLCARLRSSNIDPSAGALEEVERIVAQIRKKWPQVQIILRGDGGFCRDDLMSWCKNHGVGYVFGLAKNKRLLKIIGRLIVRHSDSGVMKAKWTWEDERQMLDHPLSFTETDINLIHDGLLTSHPLMP